MEGLFLIEVEGYRRGPKRVIPGRKSDLSRHVQGEDSHSILNVRVDSARMDLVILTADKRPIRLFGSGSSPDTGGSGCNHNAKLSIDSQERASGNEKQTVAERVEERV